jgi:hypothetical protein
MHITNRSVPLKFANGAENLVLQVKFPGGTSYVIVDLMRALWRVNLLLVFNQSLLNKEYNLINVLQAFVATVSMCSLHVILLSKITPKYFILFM